MSVPAPRLRGSNPKARGQIRGAAAKPSDDGLTSLRAAAYETIKHRILQNLYPGGFQVLEEQLCDELGMSRTPLREALVRLELEGLVEILPRRGMRVLPLDAADIADIFQVLSSLELLAVRLLAERADNKGSVERLQAQVSAMKKALAADDLDQWALADERFHRALVDESGNPRLATAARALLDQSQRFRIFTLRMRDRPNKSTRSHEALVVAIRRREVEKALEEHSHHKVNWHVQMVELLTKFGIRHI